MISVFPGNPSAVISCVSKEVGDVLAEYLSSPSSLAGVLENKPAPLQQQALTELSRYFDIRNERGYIDLYFKKEH